MNNLKVWKQTFQYKAGFAKKLLLKKESVPTIYVPSAPKVILIFANHGKKVFHDH